jgi:hypothetical protein
LSGLLVSTQHSLPATQSYRCSSKGNHVPHDIKSVESSTLRTLFRFRTSKTRIKTKCSKRFRRTKCHNISSFWRARFQNLEGYSPQRSALFSMFIATTSLAVGLQLAVYSRLHTSVIMPVTVTNPRTGLKRRQPTRCIPRKRRDGCLNAGRRKWQRHLHDGLCPAMNRTTVAGSGGVTENVSGQTKLMGSKPVYRLYCNFHSRGKEKRGYLCDDVFLDGPCTGLASIPPARGPLQPVGLRAGLRMFLKRTGSKEKYRGVEQTVICLLKGYLQGIIPALDDWDTLKMQKYRRFEWVPSSFSLF